MGVDYFANITGVQLESGQSDRILETVKHFSQLEGLYLEGARITDQGLAVLEGKRRPVRLDLSDTRVGDQGLAHVEGLRSLEILYLNGTGVSGDGLARLRGLISLTTLGLRGTMVTDAGLAHLKGLSRLESLDLDGTKITDDGLPRLVGLTKLTTLSLSETLVSDVGLTYLEGLTSLTWLNLDGTQITDSGLASVKRLTNLETLEIRSLKVTPAGVKALQLALPKLKINPVYWMTSTPSAPIQVLPSSRANAGKQNRIGFRLPRLPSRTDWRRYSDSRLGVLRTAVSTSFAGSRLVPCLGGLIRPGHRDRATSGQTINA